MSNLKFLFLGLVSLALISCKSHQLKSSIVRQTGVFKVAIFYPNGEDKTFDMDYYERKHMPLVASFLGRNLTSYEIDKGISGRTVDDKAPFAAIGYFYIKDIDEYNSSIAQNREIIINDFKNYTNIQPIIQISETRIKNITDGSK